MAAGLDVFAQEPNVPEELRNLQNVVLLPHIGSASISTRNAMDQLVVDNIKEWFAGKPPLTPIPETRSRVAERHERRADRIRYIDRLGGDNCLRCIRACSRRALTHE